MPRILIVDDEWLTRLEIEEMLTDLGYEVAGQAETGGEAITIARELNPDLILMDVEMPEMNGIAAARKIKEELGIPIVFISEYGDPEYIEAAKEMAPFGYVMKPFDAQEVYAFVEIALFKRELELKLKKANEHLKQTNLDLQKEIAARKKTEKALRESEEKYRLLYMNTPAMLHSIDSQGRVLSVSNRWLEIMGYKEDEVIGLESTEFLTEASKKYAKEVVLPNFFKKGYCEEIPYQFMKKNGQIMDVLLSAISEKDDSGKVIRSLAVLIDVTERKQTEEALRESEEKYRELVNNTTDLFYRTDMAGKIVFISPSVQKLSGYTVEEAIGMKMAEEVYYKSEERTIFLTRLQRDGYVRNFEAQLKRKDNSTWWASTNAHFFKDQDGNILGVEGITRDITLQKESEIALIESEARLRKAQSVAKIGNWEYDISTGKVLGSEEAFRIFGIERISPQLPLDRIEKCIPDSSRVKRALVDLIQKNKKYDINFEVDREVDGKVIWIHSIAELVCEDGFPKKALGVIQDVTEKREAEKEREELKNQLQQAQKMEAIGTLAGGIAHDFNNLLMGIQGRTSIMLMDKNSSHPDFEHLGGIEEYIRNAVDLTRQLLGFARGGKYEVKPTDLNELIKKESRMFGRTKKEITIHEKYEEDLWSVEIDRGQIQQVLLNIYVNAWQAMPGGGTLYVETENVTLDDNDVKPFFVEPGRYVKISATDTGVGMDKATQERLFDPFFTTKEMGRGTGLGLASVYGIIKNHDGFVNVYSEKGDGTTFKIYLPVSEKEAIEEKMPDGNILKGVETVLFVDDENMITETAKDLLEVLGYNVLTAGSGKEAIEICEENKEQIGIVILDMIMPDMGGGETYDRIRDINPNVKVLLSSGYSIDGQATEILGRGCNGFIQKPFKMEEFSQKLREILDEK